MRDAGSAKPLQAQDVQQAEPKTSALVVQPGEGLAEDLGSAAARGCALLGVVELTSGRASSCLRASSTPSEEVLGHFAKCVA